MDQLEQNTEAWLLWRKDKLGASSAPIIMCTSKFSTPHKLWMEMTGRAEAFAGNWATERGHKWEPAARARYELKSDIDLPPTIAVHPKYKFITASLDGYNKEKGIVLEIKIPGAEVFDTAKAGKCHDSYYAQVQQQLMITGAKECHFYCCKVEKLNGNERIVDDALAIVKPDPEYQKMLLEKLIEFYKYIETDTPPPLTDRDYLEAEDQTTVLLFSRVKQIKQNINAKNKAIQALVQKIEEITKEIEVLDSQLDAMKPEVIAHIEKLQHPKITSVGVNMYKNKNGVWSVRLASEVEGE